LKSINDIRAFLLESLDVSAENLITFVEGGTVKSYPVVEGVPRNKNFRMPYNAIIYVDKPKEPASYICWIIAEWMNEKFPDRNVETSIKFEADILSHTDSILEFTLELYDDYGVTIDDDGNVNLQAFSIDESEPARDVILHERGKYEPLSP